MSRDDKPPMTLSLHTVGTESCPRYLIGNSEGQYWNGLGWNEAGMLFESLNLAFSEMHRILRCRCKDKRHRRFIAPIIVDLYSDDPIAKCDLISWIVRAVRLFIHPTSFGGGPAEESVVLSWIDWHEMKEVEP